MWEYPSAVANAELVKAIILLDSSHGIWYSYDTIIRE